MKLLNAESVPWSIKIGIVYSDWQPFSRVSSQERNFPSPDLVVVVVTAAACNLRHAKQVGALSLSHSHSPGVLMNE